MNRYVLSTLAALAVTVAFAMNGDDALADHGSGCGAPAAVGCAGDYGDAGCASGPLAGDRLLARRPVRRLVGATLRVATAPVRAVGRLRFVPSRRFGGCGG